MRDATRTVPARDDDALSARAQPASDAVDPQQEPLASALDALFGPLDASQRTAVASIARVVAVARGDVLFREGEPATEWFVVTRGALALERSAQRAATIESLVVHRGALVAEGPALAGLEHRHTAIALRDSTLVSFDAERTRALPASLVARAVEHALRRALGAPTEAQRSSSIARTIAVLTRGHEDDAVRFFVDAMHGALAAHGAVARLGEADVSERAPLDATIERLEDTHEFLLLVGSPRGRPSWNEAVASHASHTVVVCSALDAPEPLPDERRWFDRTTQRHTPVTLVLVHPSGTTLPSGTARWLARWPGAQVRHVRARSLEDVARVARLVADRSVGLVLGAGGARGFAHVGVLRALADREVAVDYVGGASIGAVAAALVALGHDASSLRAVARRAVARAPLSDFTLPLTSLLRGHRVESLVRELVGSAQIEDLWLPFFCNACDISHFEEVFHDRGSLADALLESAALPGVLPPRVRDGRILVDGGTSDSLPVEPMRARNRGPVIAVDVTSERPVEYRADRYPTAWRALWERLRPGGARLPLLPELFLRAASFAVPPKVSAAAREADLFLRPPVERFGTGAVDRAHEIESIGYRHAGEKLSALELPYVPLRRR
ncbi:MAG: patatin-like phospholipase family protein [Myxococcales bacterium]|nr:patatin-like phospholipase family protein [Myxococcales bacterium]